MSTHRTFTRADVLWLHSLGVDASERDLVAALGRETARYYSVAQDRDVWQGRYFEEREAREMTLRSKENAVRWFGVASIVIVVLVVLLALAVGLWQHEARLRDYAEQLNYQHADVLASVELQALVERSRLSTARRMQEEIVGEVLK